MADDYTVEKDRFDGTKVKILGEKAEPGSPTRLEPYNWRAKLHGREDIIKHVKTSLRYWYSEGFGSEKRRTPA